MNVPSRLSNVIKLKEWRKKTFTDIYVFDLDNTLLESIGSYEKDYDLKKFIKDNTFLKNLSLKKLPLAVLPNMIQGKNNNLVVIQTSRAIKFWLPLVLWFHGIKYDVLLERPKNNSMNSGYLKKEQIKHLILFRNLNIGNVFFFDDLKENRDSIESLPYAIVHNPIELNESITYKILSSSDRLEVIKLMRKKGFKI